MLAGIEKKEDSSFPFPCCKWVGICSAPSGVAAPTSAEQGTLPAETEAVLPHTGLWAQLGTSVAGDRSSLTSPCLILTGPGSVKAVLTTVGWGGRHLFPCPFPKWTCSAFCCSMRPPKTNQKQKTPPGLWAWISSRLLANFRWELVWGQRAHMWYLS